MAQEEYPWGTGMEPWLQGGGCPCLLILSFLISDIEQQCLSPQGSKDHRARKGFEAPPLWLPS